MPLKTSQNLNLLCYAEVILHLQKLHEIIQDFYNFF